MTSPTSVDVFPAETTSIPNHLYAPSLHSVKSNAVFLLSAPSGLNVGRCVTFYRCFVCLVLMLCIVKIYNQKPAFVLFFFPRTRQLAGYGIMSAVLTMLPEKQVIFLITICLTVLGMSVFVILKGVQPKYKYSLFVLVCVT